MKRFTAVALILAILVPTGMLAGSPGAHAQAQTPTRSGPRKQTKPSGNNGSEKSHSKRLPKMVFVVTATRMTQALATVGATVSVIESHQIQEQKIHDSGDVLRQVPGVEVTQSGSAGNQTDVSIRGSSAAETLVLVDGVD